MIDENMLRQVPRRTDAAAWTRKFVEKANGETVEWSQRLLT